MVLILATGCSANKVKDSRQISNAERGIMIYNCAAPLFEGEIKVYKNEKLRNNKYTVSINDQDFAIRNLFLFPALS